MEKHYESNYVILEENMMDYFFKKRTLENSVYKIFVGIEGNEDFDLEEKFKECVITFMFSDCDTINGEIRKHFKYEVGEGRNLLSYMKSMIKILVEERHMTDSGHFCICVKK